jgi:tagaturonate reductase
MKKLNRTSLSTSTAYPVRVLQFGDGNFLRAFADWMIDILNEKTDFKASVKIVTRHGSGETLNAQDGLYHVLLQGIQNGAEVNETRLIRCVTGAISSYNNWDAFLHEAENPDLQFIISNTTEAGITFSESDTAHILIPESFPGKLTRFLFHRFKHFNASADKGLIFLPCELIEKNADALKQCVIQYIAHWHLPSEFRNWIENNNVFCNTLVDRIVTGFPKDNAKQIQEQLEYEDNLLVAAEPFHSWIIEDNGQIKKLLPFEHTGLNVKFVDNLAPYRARKVHILNGAHTAMTPVAYLKGIRTVRETMEDPELREFVSTMIYDEIIPTLELPGDELDQFAKDVLDRFRNPYIRHELISIALNSISKFSVRVLPTLIKYHKLTGKFPQKIIYSLAALIAFYKSEWKGDLIPLKDSPEMIAYFKEAWQKKTLEEITISALKNPEFAKSNLIEIPGLAKAVEKKLIDIKAQIETMEVL